MAAVAALCLVAAPYFGEFSNDLAPLATVSAAMHMGAVALLAALVVRSIRRWPALAAAVLALAFAYGASAGLRGLDLSPERLRFRLWTPYLARTLAALPRSPDEPGFMAFPWAEGGGAMVQNWFVTLVYDESDEVALPATERSENWKRRVRQVMRFLAVPANQMSVEVKCLQGHFYLVTETY